MAYQGSRRIFQRVRRKGAIEKSGNATRDSSQDALPFRDNVKLKAGGAAPAKEGAGGPATLGLWLCQEGWAGKMSRWRK